RMIFTLTNQPITKPKIVCHKLKNIPYERKISTNLFTYYKNLSYSKKPIRFFLSTPLWSIECRMKPQQAFSSNPNTVSQLHCKGKIIFRA
ncbi:hypothetical protein, partial [Bacteroides heparinolyticus]|uniref:hypothetical protein n=1 Tax=Prevotella heparinolytica TaxID=28113 RepID=UPI0035A1510A